MLSQPLRLLWKHRHIIKQTTLNDLRARYAGSVLGLFWLVLYPLLFLSIYAGIYVFIFRIRFAEFNSADYVVLIFSGLIPFIGFADALGTGVASVSSNANLVKNTLFPIELIPVKAVLSSQATQLVGTVMLLIAIIAVQRLSVTVLLFPVIWVFQIAFSIGFIWILSGLNVLIRDIQNIVGILVLFLMLVSPIAYTVDMIPANLAPFVGLNPLYYFIIAYQNCLVLGQIPPPHILIMVALLGTVTFTVGFWFFTRLKLVFADHA